MTTMGEKQHYEKPELETIELQPNEVLAVGCKSVGGLNVGNNPGCGAGAGCVLDGS